MSLHYFNMNPYGLTDKKYNTEAAQFIDTQTSEPLSTDTSHSMVFLHRNKKLCEKYLDQSELEISNGLSARVIFMRLTTIDHSTDIQTRLR